jgi:hypothetical protein
MSAMLLDSDGLEIQNIRMNATGIMNRNFIMFLLIQEVTPCYFMFVRFIKVGDAFRLDRLSPMGIEDHR